MRNLRPTPSQQLACDIRAKLTDIGQAYFDWIDGDEYRAVLKRFGTDSVDRLADEFEYAAMCLLADQGQPLPQAWHEGIAAAMHSLPIDCDPYKGGSEDSIAYRCGHRFATEND